MSNRDDFLPASKRAVALRAGYRCSFTNCGIPTVGPSAESTKAVANIGEAAHISGAAPGAKRYDPAMTTEERSDIDNAIWLCAKHARLVDRDDVTYTVNDLHEMKRVHEGQCFDALHREPSLGRGTDLIGFGLDIVCVGEIVSVKGSAWTLSIDHFIIGDFGALVSFSEAVERGNSTASFVLVNKLGDGRTLANAPSVERRESGYLVICSVNPSVPRTQARKLPADFYLSDKHDLEVDDKGDIKLISGAGSVSQKIKMVLSHHLGESPFNPEFGTRLAEYYALYRASPWLGRLIKLEAIRQAAIPYRDPLLRRDYTPLHCVDRVHDVEVLAGQPQGDWLPVRFDLDIAGIGRWSADISIHIVRRRRPENPALF
jgi:hypothetical protein